MFIITLVKWILTVGVIIISTNWVIKVLFVNPRVSLHPFALNHQSDISPVRKENETAVYRNVLTPNGFPLTTGLNLNIGYKIRSGNFGDIWNACMKISDGNYLTLEGEYTLSKVNGFAKHFIEKLIENDISSFGIAISFYTFSGFVCSIAGFIGSLKGISPYFLASIPQENIGIDMLIIDSWVTFSKLNGSENRYKLIVIVDETNIQPKNLPKNVVLWSELMKNACECPKFEYEAKDESDDGKIMAYMVNSSHEITSFTHMSVASSVAAFIKTFPFDHELSKDDVLVISVDYGMYVQIWPKVLSVLLHGGSTIFKSNISDISTFNSSTTLMFVSDNSLFFESILTKKLSFWQNMKLSRSLTLFSEGIFNKLGQIDVRFNNLRCVYVASRLNNIDLISSFSVSIPKLTKNSMSKITTAQLNSLRSRLSSNFIREVYAPDTIIGPLYSTNFYDYRVFPDTVDSSLTFYGSISTSLEAKLVDTQENPDLKSCDRQGMQVIRGFTIGRPVEKERLKRALQLTENLNCNNGWMPLVGSFGMWGQDGCFYEFR